MPNLGVPNAWFDGAYRQLLLADISRRLPGQPTNDNIPQPNDNDVRRLLAQASALALSDGPDDQLLAYEVATRLLALTAPGALEPIAGADVVLSRLGNFPGRKLLREGFAVPRDAPPPVPLKIALERFAREVENSVEDGRAEDGAFITLTDFQLNMLTLLEASSSASVSAPTSAGKSFVLSIDLVRRLRRRTPECVVYLVPTRALIREVMLRTRDALRANKLDVPTRSVPFPISRQEAPNGAVYVLTQERLMTLLHSKLGKPWLTCLVVDEAQSLRDGARGVLLQSTIREVLHQFPNTALYFAAPLASNPEYLIDLFDRKHESALLNERVSPVSQEIVLVSQIRRQPEWAHFEVLAGGRHLVLGTRNLDFRFRGAVYSQRAAFARAVTGTDESTLIYADDADSAEQTASALAALLPESNELDPAIRELADFVKEELHEQYPMDSVLRRGVGYHYGYMPSLVRTRLEDLFRSGLLKYLCCTSTLLQGVNLPARHIIIENPRRGSGRPMTRGDFLNLAGRAGRLLHEFHGTIWCLRPTKWDEKAYEGQPQQEIVAALEVAMQDGGTVVQRVLAGTADRKEIDLGESVLGTLFCDHIYNGADPSLSKWERPDNKLQLQVTADLVGAITTTLPLSVFTSNRGVRPDKLEELYAALSDEADLEQWLPTISRSQQAYARLEKIIQLLLRVLGGQANKRYKYLTWLATQWTFGKSLRDIIAERQTPIAEPGKRVRGTLEDIEKELRFRLVKYFVAYSSVLEHVAATRGDETLITRLEPFHVYLECGTADHVALSLISLGLSRSTALALRASIQLPENATPEQCLAAIANVDLAHLRLPALCIREIRELRGQ